MKNLRVVTYNDLSFLSFGEAQSLKIKIDEMIAERDAVYKLNPITLKALGDQNKLVGGIVKQ